ncbi:MAG: 2-C-methyl-D-erythritol 4-phosphate cytidylyltransferase [Planctomycetota bacterium]|nr:2-C-methyl-D-erythritol 4-phosphate cytidylyltransferase [Planctomycetota bacterium]
MAVILPAAGSSTRFGAVASKLFQLLCGEPVLNWTVRAFAGRADVRQIIIPTHEPDEVRGCLAKLGDAERHKIKLCDGGTCRAGSVREGALASSADIPWLAVHDAARPLTSQGLIDRTFTAALKHGAAAAALAVHLTIKEAVGPLPAQVCRTVPRDQLWAMQTPQIMGRGDLLEAFAACPIPLEKVTDDVQLLELAGKPVWLVTGEDRNLKITTPLDLQVAEMIQRSST